MSTLKDVQDQALIDELVQRGYSITKAEKRTIWQQIQDHLHKQPVNAPPRTTGPGTPAGASALKPKIKQHRCGCGHPLCDRCFPKGNRLCNCSHSLCPICNP